MVVRVHLNTLVRLLALSRTIVVLSATLVVLLNGTNISSSDRSSRGGAAGDVVGRLGLGVPLVCVGGAGSDDGGAGRGSSGCGNGDGCGLEVTLLFAVIVFLLDGSVILAVIVLVVDRSRGGLVIAVLIVIVDGSLGGEGRCAVGGDNVSRERSSGLILAVIIVIVNVGVNRAKSSAGSHGGSWSRAVLHGGRVNRLLSLGKFITVVGLGVDGLGHGHHGSRLSSGRNIAGDGSASSSGGEKARDTGPGGLLLILIGVKESLTGTLENIRDPAVLVGDTPDSNSNTALDVETGADHVGVLVTLLGQSGGRSRDGRVADVELGESNFDIKSSEALEDGGHLRARGRLADDEMALETDTIDGSAGLLEDLDNLNGAVGLLAVLLEVVVVVVAAAVRRIVIGGETRTYSLASGSAFFAALKEMARKSVPRVW